MDNAETTRELAWKYWYLELSYLGSLVYVQQVVDTSGLAGAIAYRRVRKTNENVRI